MLKSVFWILGSLCAGFIGSFFTSSAIPAWYAALNKPFFNPPNWIFAPVWTILYVLMGIAMGMIENSKAEKKVKDTARGSFTAQLALNALWSVIFFGMKLPLVAFVEILILLAAIILTIKAFYKILPPAAYLLSPYVLWVSFASVLNLFIVILN